MTDNMIYDFAIIGAGIAGASIASEIADEASVLMLEAESQPGYHATGRSAAFWTESYGGPIVQPLTSASREFLEKPPAAFANRGFLYQRRAINIATDKQQGLVESFTAAFEGSGVVLERWGEAQMRAAVPGLAPQWNNGVFEPDCCDIDVGGLHAAYLASARKAGAVLRNNSPVQEIERQGGIWNIRSRGDNYRAKTIINAAGAWADEIAALAAVKPIGIIPLRRTMVQIESDPPSQPDSMLVVAIDGSFYFKPESGGVWWITPHDEILDLPRDAAPEELDVAIAIDRFEKAMTAKIVKVSRKWAGLRSFAPDRIPVYGYAIDEPSFFWFAGQGGVGIQTAPAAARLARSILLRETRHHSVELIDARAFDPVRFS